MLFPGTLKAFRVSLVKPVKPVAYLGDSVKVDAIDEHLLMEGIQKIANRITLGLVLAALIVGAAMLMDVPTSFRILGYPGLAIIFFIAAATGGLLLIFNILFYDEKAKK